MQDLLAIPRNDELQTLSPKIFISVRRSDSDSSSDLRGACNLIADVEFKFDVQNPTKNEHFFRWHPVLLPEFWSKDRPQLMNIQVQVDGEMVEATLIESEGCELQANSDPSILLHPIAGPTQLIPAPSPFNSSLYEAAVEGWFDSLPPELEEMKEEFLHIYKTKGLEHSKAMHQSVIDHLVEKQGLTSATAATMGGIYLVKSLSPQQAFYPTEAAVKELFPTIHARLKETAEQRVKQFGELGFQFDTLNPLSLELESQLATSSLIFPFYPPRSSPTPDDDWERHLAIHSGFNNFQVPAMIGCSVPIQAGSTRSVTLSWSQTISRIPIASGGRLSRARTAIASTTHVTQLNCVVPPWWKDQAVDVEIQLPSYLMPIVASKHNIEIVEISDTHKRFQTETNGNLHLVVSGTQEWCNHLYFDPSATQRLLNDLATVGPLDLKQHAEQIATATQRKIQRDKPELAKWIAQKSRSPVFAKSIDEESFTIADLAPEELELLTSNISRLDAYELTWKELAGGWFVFAANEFNNAWGGSRSNALRRLAAIGEESDEKAQYVLPLVAQLENVGKSYPLPLVKKHLRLLSSNANPQTHHYSLAFNSFQILGSYQSFKFEGTEKHFDQLAEFCQPVFAEPTHFHRDAVCRFLRVMQKIDPARTLSLARSWKLKHPQQATALDKFLDEAAKAGRKST